MELIAGDIGGTRSRLAWVAGEARSLRFEREYPSAAFATADDLVRQFIADARQPAQAERLLLALPGPLQGNRARLTNLAWALDAADMQASLGVASVRFVNDFQAAAAGVATLTAADVVAVNPQPPAVGGVRALTGAGTGLGLAFMLAGPGGGYVGYPSEGGHADFAPAGARQARLLERLHARYGHVSWERVASGMAMHDLYDFCRAEQRLPPADARLDGAALGARAAAGDAEAEAALDLFVDLYGAWVGNVALMFQPRGGLYVGGGVTLHLLERLRSPRFLAAALDKGRMRPVVEATPIYLITQPRLGLLGAIEMATPPD